MARVADDIAVSGQIRDGRLFIRNRRDFDRLIAQMREGTEVEVTVARRRATRSLRANAYYWGAVIQPFYQHCKEKDLGYTENDLHDLCKAKFLPKRLAIADENGEIVGDYVLGGSTRSLNVDEFYDYVEQVRQWLAELGIYTEDPGERDTAYKPDEEHPS